MSFLVMIFAINPFWMNFPVFTNKEIRNVYFRVIVSLNLIADFYPSVAVIMRQGWSIKGEKLECLRNDKNDKSLTHT